MVQDNVAQGEGQNHQRCLAACLIKTDSHVQFPRIQRSATHPVILTGLATCQTGWYTGPGCDIDASKTDTKIVYRRYASLFFIAGCSSDDNELITLEIIHRYVEQMDKYYGNVCELDIIFSFTKAYYILDEILLAGELQESSKKNVLRCIGQQDSLEDMEVS